MRLYQPVVMLEDDRVVLVYTFNGDWRSRVNLQADIRVTQVDIRLGGCQKCRAVVKDPHRRHQLAVMHSHRGRFQQAGCPPLQWVVTNNGAPCRLVPGKCTSRGEEGYCSKPAKIHVRSLSY